MQLAFESMKREGEVIDHKFTHCKKCKLVYFHCDVCGQPRVAHSNRE